MSPSQPSNIAARMGRWSAQHRKKAVLGWLAFVVIAVIAGMQVGMRMLSSTDSLTGESAVAQRILSDAGYGDTADETVLVQSSDHTIRDPQFRRDAAGDRPRRQRPAAGSRMSRSPLDRGGAMLVSRDGHSALVQFNVRGDMMQTMDRVAPVLRAVASVQKSHEGFRVEEFGTASFGKAADDSAGKDFSRAEILAIPVTVLILLLAFGAFVAAILPVVLALTAFFAATGLVFITSNAVPDRPLDLLGHAADRARGRSRLLAVLHPSRARRARRRPLGRRGPPGRGSDVRTLRAHLRPDRDRRRGRPVLHRHRRVPRHRRRHHDRRGHLGARIGHGAAGAALKARRPDREGPPPARAPPPPSQPARTASGTRSSRQCCDARRSRQSARRPCWSRSPCRPCSCTPSSREPPTTRSRCRSCRPRPASRTPSPADRCPPRSSSRPTTSRTPAIRDAFTRFRTQALATGLVHDPISVHVIDRHVAIISAPLAGTGKDTRSNQALQTLRSNIIPATLAQTAGVQTVAVGGDTASSKDYNDTLSSHTPLVFMFVLGLAFLLLLVTFRSIVIPLKAIVLNLLSVGAAYGFLVAVFQWGWGEHILGFSSTGGITTWIPLFLFVVLFGLSMDYHVFVLSRIREAVDRGMKTEDAVSHGIRTTAGIVTSAALVMVVVFSIFGSLSTVSMKEIGVGLAVAVLIDATIVRAILLPATMKLLGDWNWWLPRRLHWLPQINPEAAPAAEIAPATSR